MPYVKANAVPRRNSRGGHNAAENLISALRCLYQRAADDGLIEEKDNPRPQGRQAPPPAIHPTGTGRPPTRPRWPRRQGACRAHGKVTVSRFFEPVDLVRVDVPVDAGPGGVRRLERGGINDLAGGLPALREVK